LVDGAGDQAGDLGGGGEDLGERVGEGGCGLDGDEVDFADVVSVIVNCLSVANSVMKERRHVRIVESKGRLGLIIRDLPTYPRHILVERAANLIVVGEDERLLKIKADGYNILCVLDGESFCLFDFKLVFEEELFVVLSGR
jgi:hypothetical protein